MATGGYLFLRLTLSRKSIDPTKFGRWPCVEIVFNYVGASGIVVDA
jgi:hypothetical protein